MKTIETYANETTTNPKLALIKKLLLLGFDIRANSWKEGYFVFFDMSNLHLKDASGIDLDFETYFEERIGELFDDNGNVTFEQSLHSNESTSKWILSPNAIVLNNTAEVPANILNKEQLCDDSKYLTNIIEKNAYLLIHNAMGLLTSIFKDEPTFSIKKGHEGIDFDTVSCFIDEYHMEYRGNDYTLTFEIGKEIHIHLLISTNEKMQMDSLLFKKLDSNYSIVDIADKKVIVNLPKDIFEEYYNEVNCDIQYNSNDEYCGKGCIVIENDRYGSNVNTKEISYVWKLLNYETVTLGNSTYKYFGASRQRLEEIYNVDLELCENALITYCASNGIVLEKTDAVHAYKYAPILGLYVRLIDSVSVMACPRIDNAPAAEKEYKLEYLKTGAEMLSLNELNSILGSNLRVFNFKNNTASYEKTISLRLKEGENDENPISYQISSLITDKQIEYSISLTSHIWNSNQDGESFLTLEKTFKEKFGFSVYEIIQDEEGDLQEWYGIFEDVLEFMNINFKQIDEKTFII